jgi:hypothetical protein
MNERMASRHLNGVIEAAQDIKKPLAHKGEGPFLFSERIQ